ncbi:MAG: hypothetical protein ACYC0V_13670 [Armatimonadota bacterium]
MKIELSNEQFRELFMSKIAVSYMEAFINEVDSDTDEYDRKEYLALYADQFDCSDMVEFEDGQLLVKSEILQTVISPLLHDYCDAALPMTLAMAMGIRDMEIASPGSTTKETYTRKEEEKLQYYMEKYMKEIMEHWVDRLQIVK